MQIVGSQQIGEVSSFAKEAEFILFALPPGAAFLFFFRFLLIFG
jgi:hypothetical protein